MVHDQKCKFGYVELARLGFGILTSLLHGSADSTLAPQNYQETIKQWTGVFGVSQTATDTKANTPEANYATSNFGPNVQGIYGTGVGHSVPSHLKQSEEWFGL